MTKPTPSPDLARSFATHFLEQQAIDPDLTPDNFLKDAGITQHRDVYAEHMNAQIGAARLSRTGAHEEGCRAA